MVKKFISTLLGSLLLIGLLALGVLFFKLYTSPLGAPLSLDMADPVEAASNPDPTPTRTIRPANDCNLSGTVNVQIISRDDRRWEYPYGADVIRMVKLDFDNNQLVMFDFPRDLWIVTPALSKSYNIEGSRLGQAYDIVELEEQEKYTENEAVRIATQMTAQTLYDNFGLVPDHYITFKESVLANVIDILGGLEVSIPAAITSNWFSISAGPQVISGSTATNYMRYLADGSSLEDEWGRFERQEIIFRALQEKLSDPAVLAKVPELFVTFQDSIVTDLTPKQIVDYACFLKGLDPEKNILLRKVEREWVNIIDDTMYLKEDNTMNLKLFKQQLKELFH